jgi:hypothetical protein
MKQLTFAVVMLLPLAACGTGGPSVSGSADESASTQSGSSSLSERSRALGVDQVKTTDMPALGLVADAFLRDADVRGDIPLRVRRMALLGVGGRSLRIDELVEYDQDPKGLAIIDARRRNTPFDASHVGYATPIIIALGPLTGWEISPMGGNPGLSRTYMDMLSISAMFANSVFGTIGQSLAGYQAIPPAQLRTMLAEAARQVERGEYTADLVSMRGIHFTHSTAGDFVGDARGVTWTRAGGIWFGDGRLNGQSVAFKLVSTSTLAQRQAQSGTSATQADAKVGGTSNVGPAR